MLARCKVAGFLLVLSGVLGAALAGCGNPNGLDSIQVTPASESINTGQTAQLSAIGTFGNAKHPRQQNVTTAVTWSSNKPSVATVDNAGLVTAVSAGTATITATAQAFNGQTSSSSLVTVTGQGGGGGGTPGGGSLLSLQIIPRLDHGGEPAGHREFSRYRNVFGCVRPSGIVTNSVMWLSSAPDVFPVNSNNSAKNPGAPGGVVTAYGNGGATITAEATNPTDGTIQTATATFSCPLVIPTPTTPGSCFPGSEADAIKSTVTIFNEGLDTSHWQVLAPSASGTQNVIHCGPGWINDGGTDQVCEAAYPIPPFRIPPNTVLFKGDKRVTLPPNTIMLKAIGGAFGGWSSTCIPSDASGTALSRPNHLRSCRAELLCDRLQHQSD